MGDLQSNKMKRKLVLVGGGGHCRSVLDAAARMNIFDDIVITDDEIPSMTKVLGYQVVGNDDKLVSLYKDGYKEAFITVGSIKSTEVRKNIYKKILKVGFHLPCIVDPSAVVSKYAGIGKGVFIGKNAVVNAGAVIGDMAIINTNAVVEHDCEIGKFSHISVGAIVCGGVVVEDSVFVGANATVIQGVNIARNSIIGAGSVVLCDVPENRRIVGRGGGV